MLLYFVFGSSSTTYSIYAQITQQFLEKMFATHEGKVTKYVENGHGEACDGVATAISTFSKKLVEGKEIHKRKYDLLLTKILKLQANHLKIFETKLNYLFDLMACFLNAHGEENIKLRASTTKLLLDVQNVIGNVRYFNKDYTEKLSKTDKT